jgi:hypothetical protein
MTIMSPNRRTLVITVAARELRSDAAGPSFRGQYPRPHLPGRGVPNVLGVAALELCHPMLLLVLPKADDALLCHRPIRKLPLAAATIKQEGLLRLNCYADWREISEASAPPLPGIAHT